MLDHHKTALEMLNTTESQHPNLDAQIDMSRSGATIALDYFKPQVLTRNTNILNSQHQAQAHCADKSGPAKNF